MGTLRDQEKLAGNVRPLVLNVMNFNKGDPTLLSFDDARTLFHEIRPRRCMACCPMSPIRRSPAPAC